MVDDTCTDGEGIFPGRICWKSTEMAEASQQYCSIGSIHAVRCTILERMLGFLQKVLNAGSKYMSGRLVEAMCDSISSLSSVREHRELEEMCGVAFTDRFLKQELMWERTWRRRSGEWIMHSYWADVVWEPSLLLKWRGELDGSRLWDAASDYGVSHTRGLQLLSRILSYHGKGNRPYPLCDITPLEDSWSLMGTLAVKTLQGAGDLDIF